MSEDDIDLVDVVHSLANTCRYGGHCRHFYSVAAHSIFVHDEAAKRGLPKMVLLAALLHDAGEAYWHDMGRPLKMAEGMGAYLAYLDAAQEAVELAVGEEVRREALSFSHCIKFLDNSVMKAEVRRLMHSGGKDWGGLGEVTEAFIPWWKWLWYRIPGMAKRGFLRRLRRHGIEA